MIKLWWNVAMMEFHLWAPGADKERNHLATAHVCNLHDPHNTNNILLSFIFGLMSLWETYYLERNYESHLILKYNLGEPCKMEKVTLSVISYVRLKRQKMELKHLKSEMWSCWIWKVWQILRYFFDKLS